MLDLEVADLELASSDFCSLNLVLGCWISQGFSKASSYFGKNDLTAEPPEAAPVPKPADTFLGLLLYSFVVVEPEPPVQNEVGILGDFLGSRFTSAKSFWVDLISLGLTQPPADLASSTLTLGGVLRASSWLLVAISLASTPPNP